MRLPLDAIRIDGGTQPRTSINEAAVTEYAEAYADGHALPELVVFFDGTDYWLADGFHRFHAARRAGLSELVVNLKQGTQREAILYSVGANATHGLRRTNDDKRKAVRTLLDDAEWGQWSDREIARLCGVGHPFVAAVRSPQAAARQDEARSKSASRKAAPVESDSTPAAAPAAPAAPATSNAQAVESDSTSPANDDEQDIADLLASAQRDCEKMAAEIAAMSADDQKAETLKWQRVAESAQRRQDEIQHLLNEREASLQRAARFARRICKAVGEDDPGKAASIVEAQFRKLKVAA